MSDDRNTAKAIANLANLYRLTGEVDSACYYLVEGLHYSKMLGDTSQLIGDYSNFAAFFYDYHDFLLAEEYIRRALDFEVDSSRYAQFAIPYQTLGLLLLEKGEYEVAEGMFKESVKRAEFQGDERLAAALIGDLANVQAITGSAMGARLWFDEAIRKQSKSGIAQHLLITYNAYGTFESGEGHYDLADSLYLKALALSEVDGNGLSLGTILMDRARNEMRRGELKKAAVYATEAMKQFEEVEAVHQQVACLELLVEVKEKSGDDSGAGLYAKELKQSRKDIEHNLNIIQTVMTEANERLGPSSPSYRSATSGGWKIGRWVVFIVFLGVVGVFIKWWSSRKSKEVRESN